MMKAIEGISINGELHTAHDLDLLWLKGASVAQSPEPKRLREEIPGRDGVMEYSDYYDGITFFENREITYRFCFYGDHAKLCAAQDALLRYHGRSVNIVEDSDRDFFVRGSVSVAIDEHGYNYAYFTLTVDAEPYRRRISPTVCHLTDISGTKVIELCNNTMPVQLTVCINSFANTGSGTYSLLIAPLTSLFSARIFESQAEESIVIKDFLLKGGVQRVRFDTQAHAGSSVHTDPDITADVTISYTEGKF